MFILQHICCVYLLSFGQPTAGDRSLIAKLPEQARLLSPVEARRLLEAINTGTLAGLRDRALVSVMLGFGEQWNGKYG